MRFALDFSFFFLNPTAPPELYTLSLHDALPISRPQLRIDRSARSRDLRLPAARTLGIDRAIARSGAARPQAGDRKSTRLNSSHTVISYAVFCLKKKKQ